MSVFQTNTERRIFEMIEKTLLALGYEVVRIKVLQGSNGKVLQMMLDRCDGEPVTLADCERVSKQVFPMLDVEDVIAERYTLEVSSPGINRPLTRTKDFKNYCGSQVQITTVAPVNGRRRFVGILVSANDFELSLRIADVAALVVIENNNIAEAYLKSDIFNSQ